MKEEFISTGKNVDVAITNGLNVIGKNREDVDIKILEQGGLFKKAKVVLIYEKEEIKQPVVEQIEEEKQPEIEEEQTVATEQNVEIVAETTNITDAVEEIKEVEEKQEKVCKIIDTASLKNRITDFLTELVNKYGVEATVNCEEKENELYFNLEGENVGKLIGYRGETLNAIQCLLSSLKASGEGRVRIYLDISNYKAKREETLIDLANKLADKAEEIERNVHLDPMSAYERRVIHTALQNRELVETESTGEGAKRHVVIKFKR